MAAEGLMGTFGRCCGSSSISGSAVMRWKCWRPEQQSSHSSVRPGSNLWLAIAAHCADLPFRELQNDHTKNT